MPSCPSLSPLRVALLLALASGLGPGCASRQAPRAGAPERVPVPLLEHHLTPDQIRARLAEAQAACDAALARIAGLDDSRRTFANTLEDLDEAVSRYADVAGRLAFLKAVHPAAEVRAAAAEAEEASGRYLVALASRRDLYQAVKGWQANAGRKEQLDPQQARLLELTLRDFHRNGMDLTDDQLRRLVALRGRLTELSSRFEQNLNENLDSIEVTEQELAGVPPDMVARLKKTPAGGTVVTTKYPDYFPFMENARSGEARKRLYLAFESREAARNTPLLTEAIRLRDEEARLLGYATHADFVTEDVMAKKAENVRRFLGELRERLRPLRDRNYAELTELKRRETGDAQARLEPWDARYYLNALKKRDYAIDSEALREYFPADTVVRGMFQVYQTLLGIRIEEVAGADVWDPSVKLYAVRDAGSGALMGHFYADLFPREGKYGHAASFGFTVARAVGGKYRTPVVALVANFNPPSGGKPSLLSHDEVEILFHEFGHITHQVLTAARYGTESGTNVARDFVEAPSQMLENWVYEKPVLDLMSGHFQDPSRKLPAEVVAKLKEARSFDAGYKYTRQVFLATFDLVLHTSGPTVDPDALSRRLFEEILGMRAPDTHFPATFNHLMSGYDAGYYGYLWSEVFAQDMWSRFEKVGVLDPGLGRRYRDLILAPGRSEEPDVLLRKFLGREPETGPFLRTLGLQ